MRSVILLVVGAAWVAVLLPPLLRSRLENRPGSSIDTFQSRLSSLQRSVPSTGMRSMARPLAGGQRSDRFGSIRPVDIRYAPQRVGAGQARVQQRVSGYATPAYRTQPANTPQRFDLRGARHAEHARHLENVRHMDGARLDDPRPADGDRSLERRSNLGLSASGLRRRGAETPSPRRRQSTVARQKATVKQRRQNVLFLLVLVTAVCGLLVAAAHNTASKAALAVSACALVGYIYLLAQMRRSDQGADEYYGYEAA